MMWQVFAYAVAASAALAVAGWCLERLAALQGLPRRTAWIVTLALSVLLPPAMMLRAEPQQSTSLHKPVPAVTHPLIPNDMANELDSQISPATAQPDPAPIAASKPARRIPPPTDRALLLAWALASLLFGLYLLGANLRMRRRSAAWERATVLGDNVLISARFGPALIGTFRPRIVIPRWLLDETNATQRLILEHERQHITALDPLLIRIGVLLLVALPWNLPLWWQWRRMRHAIELDCDTRVLRTGAEPRSYGAVLLGVTRRAARVPVGMVAMSEPVAALERRIENLLPDPVRHSALQIVGAMALAAAGIGTTLAMDAPTLPQQASQPEAAQVSRMPPPRYRPSTESARQLDLVMRAAVNKYPQLIHGPEQKGHYNLSIAVYADGAIRESSMYLDTLHESPPRNGRPRQSGVVYDKLPTGPNIAQLFQGQPVAGAGNASTNIRVLYSVLPVDFDDARSARRVADAVRRKHDGLLVPGANALFKPISIFGLPAAAPASVNLLTVFMNADGTIQREIVESKSAEELPDRRFPPPISESLADYHPPSVPAQAFKVLGVDAAQIGQTGFLLVRDKSPHYVPQVRGVLVRFAWPRRPGEPIGGRRN
jgi:beta-lactamase regulating signal transducer with metallopeptidase domain